MLGSPHAPKGTGHRGSRGCGDILLGALVGAALALSATRVGSALWPAPTVLSADIASEVVRQLRSGSIVGTNAAPRQVALPYAGPAASASAAGSGAGGDLLAETTDLETFRFIVVKANPSNNIFEASLCEASGAPADIAADALTDLSVHPYFKSKKVKDLARCATPRFFMIENGNDYSDKIAAWLPIHEPRSIELQMAALTARKCITLLSTTQAYYCPEQWRPLADERRVTPLVLDFGSNSGFFSVAAAKLGYSVIAVDAQPHCTQYVRLSAGMSGVSDRVRIVNAYLTRGGTLPDGNTSRLVHVKSGCFGTFSAQATDYSSTVREWWDAQPGGDAMVRVPAIDPMMLFDPDKVIVPFLKLDVEGHEEEVLLALAPAFKKRAILNILVEFNRAAVIEQQHRDPIPVFRGVIDNLRKHGFVLMCAECSSSPSWSAAMPLEADSDINTFVAAGWEATELWAYLPVAGQPLVFPVTPTNDPLPEPQPEAQSEPQPEAQPESQPAT